MSLPYALLMPMMPRGAHGAVTGLYSLSRGVGTSLGPLLAGVAIQAAGEEYRWTGSCAARRSSSRSRSWPRYATAGSAD